MRNILSITFILALVCSNLSAQIQWASDVNYQDNTLKTTNVVGTPDAFPPGSFNQTNTLSLEKRSDFGSVVVSFKNPQHAQKIIIVESLDPGRVMYATLYDEEGNHYNIYESIPRKIDQDFRTLVISFPRTPYRVKRLEIGISTLIDPGFAQIDAIGISDSPYLTSIENELGGANFNVQETLSFISQPEMLGRAVNTNYDEVKPIINSSGDRLFFVRMFSPDNIGGKIDKQDIYYANNRNNNWSIAKNIGEPLNTKKVSGICSINETGDIIYLTYQDKKKHGLYFSRKINGSWITPRRINIRNFYNLSVYQDYFVSNDGDVLIMSVEREDSKGELDLYISFRRGNIWTEPKNISGLNTPMVETSPFLTKDNQVLYFASDGHDGFGGTDIYYSKRLNDSWDEWTKPVNLGSSVNTEDYEAHFMISESGDYAYFSSSKDGKDENLYRIRLPQKEKPSPMPLLTVETQDASNSEPISADVVVSNAADNYSTTFSTDMLNNGLFNICLPNDHYKYQIDAIGYMPVEGELEIDSDSSYEYQLHAELQPLTKGNIFVVDNLLFDQSSPNLRDESYGELEKIYKIMVKYPDIRIELRGHTDTWGSSKRNFELAGKRLEFVKNYLLGQGIDEKRIETKNFGDKKPLTKELELVNPELRGRNRRVEVKIISD